MKRDKLSKKILALFLTFILTFGLLTPAAFAASTVTVRLIGQNGVILNTTMDVSAVTDYTTDTSDHGTGKNALDAVISAANSLGGYSISYSATYGTYYMSTLAGISPSGSDYWGTLAVSSSQAYDGNALSSHALTAGDTYIVYYDKYTGRGGNYGCQSYAWFTADTFSGTAGSPIEIGVKTTGYDASYNTVVKPLSYVTVYATGGSYATPTAVALTDMTGKAYITLPDAATTYTLTLSSDYTYTQCSVTTASGSSVSLSNFKMTLTNGTDNLNGALLTLTNSSGSTISTYSVSPSVYLYQTGYSSVNSVDKSVELYLIGSNSTYTVSPTVYLYSIPDGTYNYSASANGYLPINGTVAVSGATSKTVTMTAMSGYLVTITPGDTSHETVSVKNSSGTVQTATSSAGAVYTYDLANGNYTYTVSRSGYHSLFGSFSVSGASKSITTAALTDTAASSAEWPAYRSFSSNMAIISDPTAQGSWQANEKWASSLGALGSYGTLSSSNIVVYDGFLYVATEHGLAKIDSSTGNILTTTALSAGVSYAPQIAYGSGKIFATNATGIDAYDALTMEKVWSVPISAYGNYMATTPILYNALNNTIYVGDYGDSNYTLGTYGGYSAINAADGSSKWILYGGATDAHYWAGAVIVGNYLVFGSDSEKLSSVSTSSSGYASAAGTLSATGKIRSSIAYDGTYLYFTTNSGYIYKASIDSATGALTAVTSRQFSSSGSASTPVVYNGRIYVGANDGVYVLNSSDLSQLSFNAASGAVQSSALITTAYSGAVYAYFTVNSAQGEIIVLKDDGTNVSCDTLYTPSHAQYCYGSLVSDSEGTIYYSNDSGYISAISSTGADNTYKAKVIFNVTPSSIFDSSTYATTYPTVTVKDESGSIVTTASAGDYYLAAGNYAYTVSLSGYITASGSFTVSSGDIASGKTITVTLSKPSSGSSAISVTVSIQGYKGASLLGGKTVSLAEGSTAWDAIQSALSGTGISCVTKSTAFGVYIVSVNGLAEFDKGANSGWEYSVNGTKPSVGVSIYTMSSGDQLVLYYTADYTTEPGSGAVSSSGSAAADITAILNSSTGIATATLSGDALTAFNKALTSGSDAEGTKAVINVNTPSGATGISLTIPKSTASALSGTSNTSLSVETGIGNMIFDPTAIDSIRTSAGSSDVTLSISKTDSSSLSDENKALVGGHPVYNLSVTAGTQAITSFGNGFVQVTIPYTPKSGEDTSKLTVYYINSDGKATVMSGAYYDAASGSIIFTTNHFSTFAVVYNAAKSFSDVTESDWYYSAVRYVSQNSLMSGTSDTNFEPNADMTRAMLVTVLYRMEGKPTVTAAKSFTDVPDGQWYTDAVKWASANGIVSGYGNGLFGTNDSITREQLAAVMYNFAKYKGYKVTKEAELTAYTDAAEVSSWAQYAMKWAVAEGFVNGTTATTLSPSGTATRAQVSAVLMRFIERYAG